MKAYTRNDLAEDLALKLKLSMTESKGVVSFLLDRLGEVLISNRKIEFRGFGILVPHTRKKKIGRNPKDAAAGSYTIPPRKVIRFRVGKELDLKLNE